MSENTNFIPSINFLELNHPVLAELGEKVRPFLPDESFSLDRELQIRTMVYLNFNKYLTLLLLKADEDKVLDFLQKIDEVSGADRLGLIAEIIDQPVANIINNFINLFNPAD